MGFERLPTNARICVFRDVLSHLKFTLYIPQPLLGPPGAKAIRSPSNSNDANARAAHTPTDRPTDRQAPPLAREPPPPPLPPEPTQANHPKLPPPSRVTGPPDSRRCSRSLARDDDDANANDEDRLTIEGRHARSPKMPPPSDPLSKQTNRCTTPPRRPRASRPPDSSRC